MTLSNFKKITSLATCLLFASANPTFAFTLADGLTLKEVMNLSTMLEATSTFTSSLPSIDSLSVGEEILGNRELITWSVGDGRLAATFLDEQDTGFLMTGEATETQTIEGLATFQDLGVRQSSTIQWSGTFSESGWNATISGSVDNKSFLVNYTGSLTGNLGEDITISFSGGGSYDSKPVSVLIGQSQYFYNSEFDGYSAMNFDQLVQVNDNPAWLWFVGAEALVGGVVGAVATDGGLGVRTDAFFAGAATGLLVSGIAFFYRKGGAEEPPPPPPSRPPLIDPLVPPLNGTPDEPIIPALPEPIQPVSEPISVLSLLALGTLGAGSILKRKLQQQSTDKETAKIS